MTDPSTAIVTYVGPYLTPDVPAAGTEVVSLEDLLAAHLNPRPATPPASPKSGASGAPPPPNGPVVPLRQRMAAVRYDAGLVAGLPRYKVARLGTAPGERFGRLDQPSETFPDFDALYCMASTDPNDIETAFATYLAIRNPDRVLRDTGNKLRAFTLPPQPYQVTVEGSFEHWVNYLYAEARDDLRRLVCQLLSDGAGGYLTADRITPRRAQYIVWLLRRFTLTPLPLVGPTDVGGLLLDVQVPAHFPPLEAAPFQGVSYAFHATGRAPDTVLATGTARTIDVASLRDPLDRALAYHPYSRPMGYDGEPLFRLGSADNDLYSTVSIAQSPIEAVDFPLISGMLNSLIRARPGFTPLSGDQAAAVTEGRMLPVGTYVNGEGQDIRCVADPTTGGRVYVTTAWLYLVGVTEVYNTRKLQFGSGEYSSSSSETWFVGSFRGVGEMATKSIPVKFHFAAMKYERTHFGPRREDGMMYRLVETRMMPPRPLELPVHQMLPSIPTLGVKKGDLTDVGYRAWLEHARREVPGGIDTWKKQAAEIYAEWALPASKTPKPGETSDALVGRRIEMLFRANRLMDHCTGLRRADANIRAALRALPTT